MTNNPKGNPSAGIIIAEYEFNKPSRDMIKKLGIVVTAALNINVACTILKNPAEPGNLYFDNGYAHIEAIRICPVVPAAVMKTVLKIYRLNGTQDSDMMLNRSLKFLIVG